jgi:predicted KAP-like P-loop ATPase
MITFCAKSVAHRDHCFEIIDKNILSDRMHASLRSHARFFELEVQMLPQARVAIDQSRRLINITDRLLNRR